MPPLSARSLRTLAQRLYPLAQQAYRKWEAMPQEEKDRYVKDVKDRASRLANTISERAKQAQSTQPNPGQSGTTPTPPKPAPGDRPTA